MRVTRSAVSLGVDHAGAVGLCAAVATNRPAGAGRRRYRARRSRTPWRSATRSSTANGCPTTRAATAATGSGRSTTTRRASPATTRAAAAAAGRSARTSTSSAPRTNGGIAALSRPPRPSPGHGRSPARTAGRIGRRSSRWSSSTPGSGRPDRRPAQVRHRPELRRLAQPGASSQAAVRNSIACHSLRGSPRTESRGGRRRDVDVRRSPADHGQIRRPPATPEMQPRRRADAAGPARRCSRATLRRRQTDRGRRRSSSPARSATRRRCSASA